VLLLTLLTLLLPSDKVFTLAVEQLNKLQKDGIEKAKEVASKVTAKPAKAD
jgi:hypothetical protein